MMFFMEKLLLNFLYFLHFYSLNISIVRKITFYLLTKRSELFSTSQARKCLKGLNITKLFFFKKCRENPYKRYLLIEQIWVILNIISQQISWCSNKEKVPFTVIKWSTANRADLLIDVQQVDVTARRSYLNTTANQIQSFVRVVNEHLNIKEGLWYCDKGTNNN